MVADTTLRDNNCLLFCPHPAHKAGLSFLGLFCYGKAMVVRMRHTRSHTGNRRSHHALSAQVLSTCECGAPRVSHQACPSCGRYKGRIVVDMAAKAAARAQKRAEKLQKAGRPAGEKNEGQK